jgi:hypothetical protein
MTYSEAALLVLKSSRKPLSTEEITQRAVEQGLIVPRGKTPNATMAAALYGPLSRSGQIVKTGTQVKTRAKRGTVRWMLREKASPVP